MEALLNFFKRPPLRFRDEFFYKQDGEDAKPGKNEECCRQSDCMEQYREQQADKEIRYKQAENRDPHRKPP